MKAASKLYKFGGVKTNRRLRCLYADFLSWSPPLFIFWCPDHHAWTSHNTDTLVSAYSNVQQFMCLKRYSVVTTSFPSVVTTVPHFPLMPGRLNLTSVAGFIKSPSSAAPIFCLDVVANGTSGSFADAYFKAFRAVSLRVYLAVKQLSENS